MGVMWMEGFESFQSAAGTQDGLEEKYTGSGTVSGFTLVAGRTGGLALEIVNLSGILKTGAVLSGAEGTMGVAIKRTAGTQTLNLLRFYFNTLPTALWDLQVASSGDVNFRIQLATIASASAAVPNDGNWHYLHVHYFIDASGFFKLYVDGVLKLNYAGDTQGAGPEGPGTAITRFAIACGTTTTMLFDDIYFATGDFRFDCVVDTLFPEADGATSAFTPSTGDNWENVDDRPFDADTTYNEAVAASNSVDTYDMEDLGLTDVFAVQINNVVRSTSGSQTMRCVARSGGTDFPASSGSSVSTSYTNVFQVLDEDPDSVGDWDTTIVNAAEFGVKAG